MDLYNFETVTYLKRFHCYTTNCRNPTICGNKCTIIGINTLFFDNKRLIYIQGAQYVY